MPKQCLHKLKGDLELDYVAGKSNSALINSQCNYVRDGIDYVTFYAMLIIVIIQSIKDRNNTEYFITQFENKIGNA